MQAYRRLEESPTHRQYPYAVRKALLISDIENVIKEIRSVDKDVIIFVDNC
ncbi:MAG: methionine gamma-lyase family protein, partial [Alistipes sp.]|nr:methionine gamma-lyase family protein [Alistipes sp.]